MKKFSGMILSALLAVTFAFGTASASWDNNGNPVNTLETADDAAKAAEAYMAVGIVAAENDAEITVDVVIGADDAPVIELRDARRASFVGSSTGVGGGVGVKATVDPATNAMLKTAGMILGDFAGLNNGAVTAAVFLTEDVAIVGPEEVTIAAASSGASHRIDVEAGLLQPEIPVP